MKRIIGISITIGVCVGAAVGLLFAHANLHVSVGIAVVAILLGTAITRGRFGSKRKSMAPTANDE
ncbi:MAG: hypothetical protein ABSB87_12015 [Terriglobales bacterium]|jgi:hypothetical protein